MGMLFSAYSGQTFEDGVVLFNKKNSKSQLQNLTPSSSMSLITQELYTIWEWPK